LAQIVDSRVIRDAGNTNLGIVDPTIDARIDQALRTADQGAREGMWADIDHKVMEDAFVLPGVGPKGPIYRPPNLTNAFVSDGFQTCGLGLVDRSQHRRAGGLSRHVVILVTQLLSVSGRARLFLRESSPQRRLGYMGLTRSRGSSAMPLGNFSSCAAEP
jgi:hypothetical protein